MIILRVKLNVMMRNYKRENDFFEALNLVVIFIDSTAH